MLSKEDNELLTRVGPGMPMGQIHRDCDDPLQVRAMTESVGRRRSQRRAPRVDWIQETSDHLKAFSGLPVATA